MEYAALNSSKHEIRLLLLEPGSFHDEIVCALIYTSLDTKPDFEALSYTWGSPENPKPIKLDGHAFPVGVNLEAALRNLRHPRVLRVLWIDAICVNQQDLIERSEQVLLMRMVYESAKNVVIWLGNSENGSDTALNYMEILAAESTRLNYDYRKAKLPKHNPTIIKALAKFFQRPWFTRIWVLQEVGVSSQASILCGDRSLSWNELCYASWFLHEQAISRRGSDLQEVGSYVVVILAMFMTNRNLPSELSQTNANILKLLGTFQYCDATNPRDKIYALLGLAWDFPAKASQVNHNVPQFEPNYKDSVAKVYTDFAKYHILANNSLNILSKRTTQNPEHNLPSWVPDWTQYNLLQMSSHGDRLPTSAPLAGYLNKSETNITSPVASFSPDLRVIIVRGYKLAQIASVELPQGQATDLTSKATDLIVDGLMLTASLTVRAGLRLFGLRKKMAAMGVGGPDRPNPTIPHPIFSASFALDDKYITTIGSKTQAQSKVRGFTTSDGEYGATWADVARGDFICSWVGNEHFFVIRPGGDGLWRLIGGCVVPSWIFKQRADERFGLGGWEGMETFAIR